MRGRPMMARRDNLVGSAHKTDVRPVIPAPKMQSVPEPDGKPMITTTKFCRVCNTRFEHSIDTTYTWRDPKYSEMCPPCVNIREMLMNGVGNVPVYDDYLLIVQYNVTKTDHEGYCSDPGDSQITTKIKVKRYPLLKLFKKSDVNIDNSIDVGNKTLRHYRLDNKSHGNGYCNKLRASYDIISAVVILKSNVVVLD